MKSGKPRANLLCTRTHAHVHTLAHTHSHASTHQLRLGWQDDEAWPEHHVETLDAHPSPPGVLVLGTWQGPQGRVRETLRQSQMVDPTRTTSRRTSPGGGADSSVRPSPQEPPMESTPPLPSTSCISPAADEGGGQLGESGFFSCPRWHFAAPTSCQGKYGFLEHRAESP